MSKKNDYQTPQAEVSNELLSAYMDGEVTEEEQAQVDAVLASDPEVRARLEGMRSTVALLAELPRMPVPRAFTLSEADVAPPPRPSWVERLNTLLGGALPMYLRGATVGLAMLFVVLVGGDLATRPTFMPTMAPEPVMEPAMVPEPTPELEEPEMEVAPAAVPEVEDVAREPVEEESAEPEIMTATLPEEAVLPAEDEPEEPVTMRALELDREEELAPELEEEEPRIPDEVVADPPAEPEPPAGLFGLPSDVLRTLQVASGALFLVFLILWRVMLRQL